MGKHVHAVYSSVLIWLDNFPPSASAFISRSSQCDCQKCRFSSFPFVATEAVSGPYGRSVPGAPCAYPLAAAARKYALEAPGTERPYGPETACVAAEGKEETRHFRQSRCRDPEMNAEAEGGKLSSQIKTDEYTAWAFLPKTLHD